MLYNQTFNLDQVSFAAEGIKDAQQTVSVLVFMMMCYKQIFVCVCVYGCYPIFSGVACYSLLDYKNASADSRNLDYTASWIHKSEAVGELVCIKKIP